MQLNKLVRIIFIGLSVLLIGACTHNKKGTEGSAEAYDDPYATSAAAQTSGLGGSGNPYDETQNGARSASAKDTFYFDFDRSDIRDQDKPALYAKADYLIAHPKSKILLEGHTDPRGSREYNVGLGERRANAIANLLKSRGVNPHQIRVVSYGAEKLAKPGHTDEDYQLDRRAVTARLQG